MFNLTGEISEELAVEAKTDTEKLSHAIENIRSNPKDWIVSDIKEENNEVTKVGLKPLDVSPYCKELFEKCDKTFMMSATILDKDAFCKSLGLAPKEVKFIQVPSDFPLQNRPMIPLNIAYVNSDSLKLQEVQIKIARAINNLMNLHRNEKGIIHTTLQTSRFHQRTYFARFRISRKKTLRYSLLIIIVTLSSLVRRST
jgi:ATP-dependent DNA helicase DinG